MFKLVQSAEEYFRISLYNEFCYTLLLKLKKDSPVLTLKALVSYSCYQMSIVAEKDTSSRRTYSNYTLLEED